MVDVVETEDVVEVDGLLFDLCSDQSENLRRDDDVVLVIDL